MMKKLWDLPVDALSGLDPSILVEMEATSTPFTVEDYLRTYESSTGESREHSSLFRFCKGESSGND